MADIKDEMKQILNKTTDYSGSKSRKFSKGILGVVIVVLLGALGLELGGKDFDIGSMIEGNSMSDSEVVRDESGNLVSNSDGSLMTRILRDKTGNEVAEGTANAKYTDEYNCDDFSTQGEAQTFFTNAGGLRADTNRLDGDKDGEACESLPVGTR